MPPSVPEHASEQESEEDKEQQWDQAEQAGEAEWVEEERATVVGIRRHAYRRGGQLAALNQALGDPQVVGVYAQTGYNSQQSNSQEYPENNSTVHFLLLF